MAVFKKKKTQNICIKQANPLFHVEKSIKMWKNNGTKINQGAFRIGQNVRLIAINRDLTMTLMRLIAIKYFNRSTALIYACVSLSWLLFCVFHMKHAGTLNAFWCLMTILPSYAHCTCYPPKLWQWSNKSDHCQSERSLSSASSYHPVPVNCACAPDQACSLGTDGTDSMISWLITFT